jgi:hypothetical protein
MDSTGCSSRAIRVRLAAAQSVDPVIRFSLERDFQLRSAMDRAEQMDRAALLEALHHSWRLLLSERETSEELLRGALGFEVQLSGSLLPNSLSAAAG